MKRWFSTLLVFLGLPGGLPGRGEEGKIRTHLRRWWHRLTRERADRAGTDGDLAAGDGTTAGLYEGEMPGLIGVIQTHADADQKFAKRVKRPAASLTASAHAAVKAWERLERVKSLPAWEARRDARAGRGPVKAADEGTPRREHYDPNAPAISPAALLMAELVFLVVEIFFYYSVFSRSYGSGYGPFSGERIGAYLLGLAIPLVGVVAARVGGVTGQRWFMKYEGVTRRRHLGGLIVVVSLGFVALAIFQLVHFRFDEGASKLSAPVSPFAMAVLFVAFLLLDTCARIFLTSEIRAQYDRVEKDYERKSRQVIDANNAYVKAWTELSRLAEQQVAHALRVEGVGAHLIFEARSRWGDPAGFAPSRQRTASHVELSGDGWGQDRVGFAVPSTSPLHLLGDQIPLGRMPVLDGVVELLKKWQPLTQGRLDDKLRQTWLGVRGGDRENPPHHMELNGWHVDLDIADGRTKLQEHPDRGN